MRPRLLEYIPDTHVKKNLYFLILKTDWYIFFLLLNFWIRNQKDKPFYTENMKQYKQTKNQMKSANTIWFGLFLKLEIEVDIDPQTREKGFGRYTAGKRDKTIMFLLL